MLEINIARDVILATRASRDIDVFIKIEAAAAGKLENQVVEEIKELDLETDPRMIVVAFDKCGGGHFL